MLRVAIVHFHLRTGGVTRVIEHACTALADEQVKIAVLVGELPPQGASLAGAEICCVEGLGYQDVPTGDPGSLADRLQAGARQVLGSEPDLWHCHNHNLGKNTTLPPALRQLAEKGSRILYQIHDFAEDGRPAEYRGLLDTYGDTEQLGRQLYPDASQVHYATLNDRDHGRLGRCGLDESRSHLLPNAVDLPSSGTESTDKSGASRHGRFFIYPTRAIRRKNIGELLLWAALTDNDDQFGVTRAPANPIQKPVYERWVEFAQRLNLPVQFEVGSKSNLPFDQLLRSADALISTSIAEGFGLVFLEPWLMDRPLLGRRLPQISGQIENAGVDLSSLYERLDVPVQWVGVESLRQHLEQRMTQALQAYDRSCTTAQVDAAFASMVLNDKVDFGRLDEPMQQIIIEKVKSSQSADQIQPPVLDSQLPDAQAIADNRRVVERMFGIDQYRRRLLAVYQEVASSSSGPVSSLSAQALLDQFLDPQSFNLLRS